MDGSGPDPTIVLKVNIDCCNACHVKVKKGLMKLDGVNSVRVDREKRLVYVTGNVEAMELMKQIEKWGKKAKLVSCDDPRKDEDNDDQDRDHVQYMHSNKDKKKKNARGHTDAGGKHNCCTHNDFEGHGAEPYAATPTGDFGDMCADPFCKLHNREMYLRNNPHFLHPMEHGPFFQGGAPYPSFYNGGVPPHYHQQYGPSLPFGYHHRRPMPLIDGFTNFFNDDNTGGCSIM
ncbi:hypothetical protein RJ639_000381 [Escallonia herrerae]|uniref:HMA domain-containing protein n=1 Tax=Escallonia herrerae TaxID=1293975 RepID=A0AA88XBB0_9ASTE|nr:hypothetical protein RJ639_000381 [Escallonia herrerae]